MQTFNTYMTANQSDRASWIDWYPIEERLLKDARADDDAVLMVDIAGGRGHYLVAFKEKFPHMKGRMILQEVPHVIDDAQNLHPSIERMKHDMFEPQPIKGNTKSVSLAHIYDQHEPIYSLYQYTACRSLSSADRTFMSGARIYFFHFIFHDWSDHHCHQILTQIAAAMKPGYSKLILGEFILPNTETPLLAAGFDLQMMALHSSMERSERQWRALLEGAGLTVAKISSPLGMGEGIVEAVRME